MSRVIGGACRRATHSDGLFFPLNLRPGALVPS
jgi:hypothetical protein